MDTIELEAFNISYFAYNTNSGAIVDSTYHCLV